MSERSRKSFFGRECVRSYKTNTTESFRTLKVRTTIIKLPTCDAVLLRSGVFKTIGMFMVHAAIHSGLAFVGLSREVTEYLTMEVTDGDTPLTIGVEDLPSVEERAAIHNVSSRELV